MIAKTKRFRRNPRIVSEGKEEDKDEPLRCTEELIIGDRVVGGETGIVSNMGAFVRKKKVKVLINNLRKEDENAVEENRVRKKLYRGDTIVESVEGKRTKAARQFTTISSIARNSSQLFQALDEYLAKTEDKEKIDYIKLYHVVSDLKKNQM